MKTREEIEAMTEKLRDLVNDNDRTAEVIYDTLRWVTGEQTEDPYVTFIGDED